MLRITGVRGQSGNKALSTDTCDFTRDDISKLSLSVLGVVLPASNIDWDSVSTSAGAVLIVLMFY